MACVSGRRTHSVTGSTIFLPADFYGSRLAAASGDGGGRRAQWGEESHPRGRCRSPVKVVLAQSTTSRHRRLTLCHRQIDAATPCLLTLVVVASEPCNQLPILGMVAASLSSESTGRRRLATPSPSSTEIKLYINFLLRELGKNMTRLCQWWWCHWNAILVVILDMSAVNARRRRPNTKGRGDAEMSTLDEHTIIDDRLRWQAMPKIFTTDALWTVIFF
uniref:Uncharacterized protein n=1 Tax=Oryza barthii TaxID=65489 RepID=A0A2I4S653_9ORYZ|nr:hypothetical protein BAR_5 [Oryza barthii]